MDVLLPEARPPAGAGLVVVGGCGGIGWAIVQAAEAGGLQVAILDLPDAIARRGPAGPAIPIDVRTDASVAAAFARLDDSGFTFAYAVNAFGGTRDLQGVADLDRADFDALVAMNMGGLASCLREEVRRISGPGGAIVNLSTGIASRGAKGYAAYAAAKAGVNALTRVAAADAAPAVRVNAIAPGPTDTAFLRGGYDLGAAEEGDAARISVADLARATPLGRIGRAQDMAGPALFLLSPAAAFITGQVLHVNGGAQMRD